MLSGERHALVLVVGDLGHSPRMQNHVRELLSCGHTVDFVGFTESALPPDLNQRAVRVVAIPQIKFKASWLPLRLAEMVLKVLVQTAFLLWMGLFRLQRPDVILVQSPPVPPTLLVGPLLSWWHRALYIVDWHNVGCTILAQTVHVPWIIGLAKALELLASKRPDVNLVVSKAQQQWLQINAGTTSVVVYDRPNPAYFRILEPAERKTFRSSLRGRLGWDTKDRPILVSSTSWTPDEDFGMLVEALKILDKTLSSAVQLIVTGKGPMKEQFEEQVFSLGLEKVQFATVWLSFEEYALLLGSADLGICLHVSSSGVDLPMKAIDMISAGLPVVARQYAAIGELIEDGDNGFLFDTAPDLAETVQSVISGKRKCKVSKLETWPEHWASTVGKILARQKTP